MASTNATSYTTGRTLPPIGGGNTITLVSQFSVAANPTANDTIKLFHQDDLRGLRLVTVHAGASVDMDSATDFAFTLRANDDSTQQNIAASSTILQGTTALLGPSLGAAIGYKFTGTHWIELLWTVDSAGFTAGTVTVIGTFVRDHV